MANAEFTVSGAYRYNRSGPARWIISHVRRYPIYLLGTLATTVVANWMASRAQVEIGRAFDHVASPGRSLGTLLAITLGVLGFGLGAALLGLLGNVLNEFLAQRLERDARDELYLSLLGKSLTFHGRQRLGDVMARATNDVRQLNLMFSPGLRLIISSGLSLVIPIAVIGGINPRLLLVPLLFVPALVLTVWHYNRELALVASAAGAVWRHQRPARQAISGIEVVKANAQEPGAGALPGRCRSLPRLVGAPGRDPGPLLAAAGLLRDVRPGLCPCAASLPAGQVTVGTSSSLPGSAGAAPTFISIFTFSLVQLVGRQAHPGLIEARTELDEERRVAKPIVGMWSSRT